MIEMRERRHGEATVLGQFEQHVGQRHRIGAAGQGYQDASTLRQQPFATDRLPDLLKEADHSGLAGRGFGPGNAPRHCVTGPGGP